MTEKGDARLRAGFVFGPGRIAKKTLPGIEELKRETRFSLCGADKAHGPRARGQRFHFEGPGHDHNQTPHGGFGRAQHPENSAMERPRDAPGNGARRQSQQLEQTREDADEGGFVGIDGWGQVQDGLPGNVNK